MQLETIRQGDQFTKEIGVDGVDTLDGNWSCHITMPDPAGGNHLIDNQAVTAKNGDGSAFVVSVDSAALDPTVYVLGVQLKNTATTPVFNKEERIFLKVLDGLVN